MRVKDFAARIGVICVIACASSGVASNSNSVLAEIIGNSSSPSEQPRDLSSRVKNVLGLETSTHEEVQLLKTAVFSLDTLSTEQAI